MTNGCKWQDKSFSVAVISEVRNKCIKCGGEGLYKHNGDLYCIECYQKIPSLRSRLGLDFASDFHTTKDKLYDFIDYKNFGKPVEIRSKGQWNRELKKRGLTDDFTQSPAKHMKEVMDKKDKDNYKTMDKKWVAEQIHRELKEKGLHDKVFKRR